MNRTLGLTLLAGLLFGLNAATQAQTCTTDYYGDAYGPSAYGEDAQPFGGFGFEYAQGPPASGIVMNRWGQVVGTTGPAVTGTGANVVVTQPAARTTIRTRAGATTVQPRYVLPTGYLGSTGGYGGYVNSPAMRARSYGYGYALSPYGTTQYFGPWKGLTLGY